MLHVLAWEQLPYMQGADLWNALSDGVMDRNCMFFMGQFLALCPAVPVGNLKPHILHLRCLCDTAEDPPCPPRRAPDISWGEWNEIVSDKSEE